MIPFPLFSRFIYERLQFGKSSDKKTGVGRLNLLRVVEKGTHGSVSRLASGLLFIHTHMM